MNLLEVATYIQEGYRSFAVAFKDTAVKYGTREKFVFKYVMIKGKGEFTPKIIDQLIELETSIPDQFGV